MKKSLVMLLSVGIIIGGIAMAQNFGNPGLTPSQAGLLTTPQLEVPNLTAPQPTPVLKQPTSVLKQPTSVLKPVKRFYERRAIPAYKERPVFVDRDLGPREIYIPPIDNFQEVAETLFIGPEGQVKITNGKIKDILKTGTLSKVEQIEVAVWGISLKVNVLHAEILPRNTNLVVGNKVNIKGTIEEDTGIIKAKVVYNISQRYNKQKRLLEQLKQILKQLNELRRQMGMEEKIIRIPELKPIEPMKPGEIKPEPAEIEPGTSRETETKYCTKDVKRCPDGTWVSRIPPSCEFAPCPTEAKIGELTVISPNGGEELKKGESYEIKWKQNLQVSSNSLFSISLVKGSDGHYYYKDIFNGKAQEDKLEHSYLWIVPRDIEEGDDYKIEIKYQTDPSSADNRTYIDTSDNYFSITE